MQRSLLVLMALAVAAPALAGIQWTQDWSRTRPCSVYSAVFDPDNDDTVTQFVSIQMNTTGENIISTTTEGDVDNFVLPMNMVAWGLRCEVDTDPSDDGDTEAWDCELSDDGADALSCSIGPGSTTCEPETFARIRKGSRLNFTITNTDGSTSPPADSAEMWISFCLAPAVNIED